MAFSMSQCSLDTTTKTNYHQERHNLKWKERKKCTGADISSQTVARKPPAKALITDPGGPNEQTNKETKNTHVTFRVRNKILKTHLRADMKPAWPRQEGFAWITHRQSHL